MKTSATSEIANRHRAVAAGDMRFTDKVAHRDRGLLLDHIRLLEAEADQARRLSLELYTVTTGPAVRRARA